MPQRLLLISHDANLAGAQLALADSAQVLAQAGVAVHVVVPPGHGALPEVLARRGAVVHRLPAGPWARLPHEPRRAASVMRVRALIAGVRIARLVRRVRADLIVTNTSLPSAGALAARLTRVPHAWWLHEQQTGGSDLRFARSLEAVRRVMVRAGPLLVPSAYLAAECATWAPAERVQVLTPVVRMPAALPPAAPVMPTTLLFPGGLQPVKRPVDAVLALAALREEFPDLVLHVVGPDGSERMAVEEAALSNGIAERVVLDGFRPSLEPLLAPGSVLVSCGAHETFGRVLVEAMAAGVPVIAADAGASPEVVRPGTTGLLYPAGDPAALADTVRTMLRDGELRQRLVAAASAHARTTWDGRQHLADFSQLWRSVRKATHR